MNIRRIINYIISPEGAALAGMIVATPALIAAFFGTLQLIIFLQM